LSLSREMLGRTRFVLRRPAWVAVASIALATGTWTVYTFIGPAVAAVHWDRYLRVAVDDSELSRQLLSTLSETYDASAARNQERLSEAAIHQLEQVIYWDPSFARAHARLADRYMTEFELRLRDEANVMEISQVRDAAIASAFASPEQLRNWLNRAFGAKAQLLFRALDQARQAVQLCPLQGEAYLYLADLCFLEGGSGAAIQAYVDQGLRVRPYDQAVLYRAGVQALSFGRLEDAIRLWSACYHVRGNHQARIIYRLVASGMPASLFVATFQPDWQTLREVWKRYRQFGTEQDLGDLLAYAAEATERYSRQQGSWRPDVVWYWQSLLYTDVGRTDEALVCLHKAYGCNPRTYNVRFALGEALLAEHRYAEAEPHIRWCLARRPENRSLSAALVEIAKHRLAERELNESRSPSAMGGWRE
jgi:tetratricopeptide (TPR) repeat protein